MDDIYHENPQAWPCGISEELFADGDLFLIRKQASTAPVGFVGWQESIGGNGRRVGMYSIGVLPEYRRQGFAKQAVTQILEKKSAGVDEVKAYVVPGNTASVATARAVGIEPTIKSAAAKGDIAKKVWEKLAPVLGHAAAGTAAATSIGVGKEVFSGKELSWDNIDAHDKRDFLYNAALGAAGSRMAGGKNPFQSLAKLKGVIKHKGVTAEVLEDTLSAADKAKTTHLRTMLGLGSGGLLLKDLFFKGNSVLENAGEYVDKLAPKDIPIPDGGAPGAIAGLSGTDKAMLGGLGGAALLGGGYLGLKALRQQRQDSMAMRQVLADKSISMSMDGGMELNMPEDKGSISITLPTKNPDDAETVIRLPMGSGIKLPKTLLRDLSRDTKRKLREETGGRTHHKKPAVRELALNEEHNITTL